MEPKRKVGVFRGVELSLFGLMDVMDATARILGRKADVMTRTSLHLVLRERIEASAVRVF